MMRVACAVATPVLAFAGVVCIARDPRGPGAIAGLALALTASVTFWTAVLGPVGGCVAAVLILIGLLG